MITSLIWCLGLRLIAGSGVALPFGPNIAPVWIFAIVGSTILCVPIVSTRLSVVEKQAARNGPALRGGRTIAYLAVLSLALGLFAGNDLTVSFVAVSVGCAAVGLAAAVALSDAAMVVMVAAGLVLVFCSTFRTFSEIVIGVDHDPALVLLPTSALMLTAGASVCWRAGRSSQLGFTVR